ncbi:helix-turn-helix domain-containing protein [Anaerolentibacter hominis]|uniref:helix-turn-helix domain-containing protein n=1 Tax=Anaerolentibacter hominis TaxID=3079009 RepID=UPI0031B84DEF
MKNQNLYISQNLALLRQYHKYSQEEVAGRIGVSRQAVAKWEAGETIPDIINCDALASLYDVSVDDLIHFNQTNEAAGIPPKGKHIFGTVRLGERGQVVLPKKAREIFHLKTGDLLMVLGDENPETRGLALVSAEDFLGVVEILRGAVMPPEEKTPE